MKPEPEMVTLNPGGPDEGEADIVSDWALAIEGSPRVIRAHAVMTAMTASRRKRDPGLMFPHPSLYAVKAPQRSNPSYL